MNIRPDRYTAILNPRMQESPLEAEGENFTPDADAHAQQAAIILIELTERADRLQAAVPARVDQQNAELAQAVEASAERVAAFNASINGIEAALRQIHNANGQLTEVLNALQERPIHGRLQAPDCFIM